MIIEMLLDVIYNLFSLLTSHINIPSLPAEVEGYLITFFDYLEVGAGILANYSHFDYLMILFSFIIVVDVAIKVYHFVMWILKKIPVAGVE